MIRYVLHQENIFYHLSRLAMDRLVELGKIDPCRCRDVTMVELELIELKLNSNI